MVPLSSAADASSPLPVFVSTVTETGRNRQATPHVQDGVDAEEAQAVQAEGLDPDDPAVIAAIDLVRWELSLLPLTEAPQQGWLD
jgi:hypothetical protein